MECKIFKDIFDKIFDINIILKFLTKLGIFDETLNFGKKSNFRRLRNFRTKTFFKEI